MLTIKLSKDDKIGLLGDSWTNLKRNIAILKTLQSDKYYVQQLVELVKQEPKEEKKFRAWII